MTTNVSRRQKNAAALRVKSLINELEADMDERTFSVVALRDRFHQVETAYRVFQDMCTGHAKYLEYWDDVDRLARLRAECAEMEKDYSMLFEYVNKRIVNQEGKAGFKTTTSDFETRSMLFQSTSDIGEMSTAPGKEPSRQGEPDADTEPFRGDDDNRSSVSRSSRATSRSQGRLDEMQEIRDRMEVLLRKQDEAVQRSRLRSYTEAQRPPVTSTPKMAGGQTEGWKTDVSPIEGRRREDDRESVMDHLSQHSLTSSDYTSYRGFKQEHSGGYVSETGGQFGSVSHRSSLGVAEKVYASGAGQAAHFGGSYVKYKQAQTPASEDRRGHMAGGARGGESLCQHTERHLLKLKIPEFKGDARNWEWFWAAFLENVDQDSTVPVNTKLLHLHNALSDEPKRIVEILGHGPEAYFLAMEKLEEKYGGPGRTLNMRIKELQKAKAVRDGNLQDLERYLELVDALVLSMRRAGQHEELGSKLLYMELKQKMGHQLLAQYSRWLIENQAEPTVYVLRSFVQGEVRIQIETSEMVHGYQPPARREKSGKSLAGASTTEQRGSRPQYKATGFDKEGGTFKCRHCGEKHGIWRCMSFQALKPEERWRHARDYHLCFRCLSTAHRGIDCTWNRRCGVGGCTANHHVLLHDDKGHRAPYKGGQSDRTPAQATKDQPKEKSDRPGRPAGTPSGKSDKPKTESPKGKAEPATPAMMGGHKEAAGGPVEETVFDEISLRTVAVRLYSANTVRTVMAMLDDGSMMTYISRDLASHMGMSGEAVNMGVHTMGGGFKRWVGEKIKAQISAWDGDEILDIKMRTVPQVMANIDSVDWRSRQKSWDHLKGIPFPPKLRDEKIELLIGVDNFHLHSELDARPGRPGQPYARLTPLGWTAVGPSTHEMAMSMCARAVSMCVVPASIVEDQVARFWKIMEPAKREMRTAEERSAEEQLNATCTEHEGFYEMGLPWRDSKPELPDSYPMALQRLRHTEKKLLKDPKVAEGYQAILDDYTEKGYIRKVDEAEESPMYVWYIPHFVIIRLDKETTKLRIVFDGSAMVRGVSLNSFLLTGPNLQCNLMDVLLRFRRWPVAVVCDIAEMYLQIRVRQQDRGVLRFLWRDMDTSRKPDVYESGCVMFGLIPSPCQAHFSRKRNAEKHAVELPLAAETVLKSTYMDDGLDSVRNVGTALSLYQELLVLWAKIGMRPRKWASNKKEVLAAIPVKEHMKAIQLDSGELGQVKTLGVSWNAQTDGFTFDVKDLAIPEEITKRSFLSAVATVFDPLGLAGPVIIVGRILLQKMWMAGLEWDQVATLEIAENVREWYAGLPALSDIRVPRALVPTEQHSQFEVHVFSDASGDAYGAVAYSRVLDEHDVVRINLIAGRVKVAPMQATSIPRLELLGAALGVKLAEVLKEALQLGKEHVHHWTDSTDVLYWVHGCSRKYRPFIANRVGTIQAETDLRLWHHVPTKENPADCLSRGLSARELVQHDMWWNGPAFLKESADQWPQIPVKIPQGRREDRTLEKAFVGAGQASTDKGVPHLEESHLEPDRFSNWKKMIGVAAWVIRFTQNCSGPDGKVTGKVLSPEERADAEVLYVRYAQAECFAEELRALQANKAVRSASKLTSLQPWLDRDGIMRINGRLQDAEDVHWETKNSVILPRSHAVTRLVIRHHHEEISHGGVNHTLSEVTKRFWIIAAREAIRSELLLCMVCRRRRAMPASQVMAPLPAIRTQKTLQAFQNVSVDFAGPFLTKQGRGRSRQKRYLCLFDCLNTRGVHLELAMSLDTHDFLNALSRMIARRGKPSVMWSDNGTNFVSANRELQDAVRQMPMDSIEERASQLSINWRFNPPAAPHQNGVHEILVKAAKRAMHVILSNAEVSDDELATVIVTVEGLMNTRPLGYQSSDPTDFTPLTPNHFLMGRAGENMSVDPVDDRVGTGLRKRWRRIQEVARHFWERWQKEILPALQPRSKWRKDQQDVATGDVVIVVDPDLPRGKWSLGRIQATFPGSDGHVRTVDVQTRGHVYRRPIQRVCPLDVEV